MEEQEQYNQNKFQVGDLVSYFGPARAEPLKAKILAVHECVRVYFQKGRDTRKTGPFYCYELETKDGLCAFEHEIGRWVPTILSQQRSCTVCRRW